MTWRSQKILMKLIHYIIVYVWQVRDTAQPYDTFCYYSVTIWGGCTYANYTTVHGLPSVRNFHSFLHFPILRSFCSVRGAMSPPPPSPLVLLVRLTSTQGEGRWVSVNVLLEHLSFIKIIIWAKYFTSSLLTSVSNSKCSLMLCSSVQLDPNARLFNKSVYR